MEKRGSRRKGEAANASLWELVRADIAEAEFIELTVSQLVQSIDHVVVTALKGSINSRGFQYR
jgi:hypothetical protein